MQLSIVSLLLLGVSLSLASSRVLQLQRGSCPEFWYNNNGRCYKYVATASNWADAEIYCRSQNANLVSIYSQEEDDFVKTLINNFDLNKDRTWIGLSDVHKEGTFMWSDGCPLSIDQWSGRQPDNAQGNENCAVTNWGEEKKWNDGECDADFPFVCATRKTNCQSWSCLQFCDLSLNHDNQTK